MCENVWRVGGGRQPLNSATLLLACKRQHLSHLITFSICGALSSLQNAHYPPDVFLTTSRKGQPKVIQDLMHLPYEGRLNPWRLSGLQGRRTYAEMWRKYIKRSLGELGVSSDSEFFLLFLELKVTSPKWFTCRSRGETEGRTSSFQVSLIQRNHGHQLG